MTTLALLAMSGRKGSKRLKSKAYRRIVLELQLQAIADEPGKYARKRTDSEEHRRGQK